MRIGIKGFIRGLRLSEKIILVFYVMVFLWEIVFVCGIKG
jgi:hypothetical protein